MKRLAILLLSLAMLLSSSAIYADEKESRNETKKIAARINAEERNAEPNILGDDNTGVSQTLFQKHQYKQPDILKSISRSARCVKGKIYRHR